jgi:hypothetical protein
MAHEGVAVAVVGALEVGDFRQYARNLAKPLLSGKMRRASVVLVRG